MACGDRYKHLLVTPNHGYTPENTYGLFAVPWDVSDWRALADNLTLQALAQVKRLRDLEAEKEPEEPRTPELEERVGLLVERVDAIPSGAGVYLLTGPAIEQAIAAGVQASKEAACVLELADDGLQELGATVKLPGGSEPATTPKVKTGWLLVAAIAAAGLFAYSKWGGDE